MELRYITYADGNFQSCHEVGIDVPVTARAAGTIAPAAGDRPATLAPPESPASATAAPLRKAELPGAAASPPSEPPAGTGNAAGYDFVAVSETAGAEALPHAGAMGADHLFASGDIPDALVLPAPFAGSVSRGVDAEAPPLRPRTPLAPSALATSLRPAGPVPPQAGAGTEAAPPSSIGAAAARNPARPATDTTGNPSRLRDDTMTAELSAARQAERRAHQAQIELQRDTELRARVEARKKAQAAHAAARAQARKQRRDAKRIARYARAAAREGIRGEREAARTAARGVEAMARARRRVGGRARGLWLDLLRPANLASVVGIAAALGVSGWYVAAQGMLAAWLPPETEIGAAEATSSPAQPPMRVPTIARPAKNMLPRLNHASLLTIAALEHKVERRSFQHVIRVQPRDDFFVLLMRSGVPGAEAQLARISLAGVYDARKMRAGQLITVDFGVVGEQHNRFLGIRFDSSYDKSVVIQRQPRGEFVATEIRKELTLELLRSNGKIDNSMFQAALGAGLPPEPVVRLINMFAYDVDFERDIQKGDQFEVLMELHRDSRGDIVRYGNILYAALNLQGNVLRLYRWQGEDGEPDYFNDKGESSGKALMRTPIDGARLSSGFGYRRHPVLGYSRLHQGIDFAAPTGTPIFAAGNGHVERAGWQGGYGNAVVIRHNKEYSTLYGHMSGLAPGVQPGKRVRQGEVIGYVGSTGMSTGPHLHYEVHVNGQPIDPLSLRLPSRQRLQGQELARYLDQLRKIEERYRALAKNGAVGTGIASVAEREPDPGCVNGLRLDPTDKRACD